MSIIKFRCVSQRFADVYYEISAGSKSCSCQCDGYFEGWCSHIDATIVCGERAMVHPDDLDLAARASARLRGKLKAPDDWKASWRRNMRWRGLATRKFVPSTVGLSGRPVVCFTGAMDRPRKEFLAEAEKSGWEPVNRVHSKITVMVSSDPHSATAKMDFARWRGIPILSPEEWEEARDFGVLPPVPEPDPSKSLWKRLTAPFRYLTS
ncbi:hypothetical protein M2281_005759 [Mesorhizobium soli]|uniref:hypothetical protein n=1 Tax=Pseudaminobacter soli (ex Li et al. 2025) TaxID=1295366 RepID=UPI002475A7C1|nr:hypothetical protein [Mesorhizobium soli]MDH6235137.1 hypothetical protein [Mesorhizobium soli]